MNKATLDKEEKEILKSLEAGEWKPVANLQARKKTFKQMAKNTMIKTKRITLRVAESEVA